MGFYFRKSKSLLGGLFRLNFSKRGIGVSSGVKGARFVVGPAGTYVHLGRKGFYYKKYLGKGLFKSDKEKDQYNQLAKDFHVPSANEIPVTITTSNFDRITDSESADFINELQEKDKKIRFQKIFGLYPSIIILLFVAYKLFEVTSTIKEHQNYATVKNETVNLRDQPTTVHSKILEKSHKGDKFSLLEETETHWFKVLTTSNDTAFIHGDLITTSNELVKSETIRRFNDNPNMRYILFGAAFIPLLLLNIILFSNDKRRKSIFITYELDEIVQDLQKDLLAAFKQFSNSSKKWQIINARRTNDSKYSGGANVTVDRKEIKELSSHKLPSSFFETNIKIPFIGLKNTELYFLPDRLLLKRNNKFAAVQYGNLNVDILPVSFREFNGVPSDSTVADYTYKYVNKSGGADRRFANNPKIPICAYSEYHFSSDEGINEIIMPSKSDALDDFVIQLRTIGKLQSGNYNTPEIKNESNHTPRSSAVPKPNKNSFSREYYNLLVDISKHLSDVTDKLKYDEAFTDNFKHTLSETPPETFVPYCVLYDMIQIFKILTDGKIKLESVEMSGLVLLSMRIIEAETDFLSFDYETISGSHLSGRFKNMADTILEIADKSNPLKIDIQETKDGESVSSTKVPNNLSLPATLKLLDHPLFDDYVTTLYRFATIIAKADNVITKKEENSLKEIYQITHKPVPVDENKAVSISEVEESESLEQVLAELDGLIGLDDVKREVRSLINFVQIQKEREKQGLKNSQVSYHCVFTGSPGTGKTTIARLVAKIYKHLEILEKGQLVETDRSGLVAEYLGQTATKVDKVVKSALDGILFIDEAYALVGQGNDDYGKEAVAALIKRMEDNREKLVLIVAGYSEEMKIFIDSNPGFKSRFNRYIHFPDYTPYEMIGIYELLCSKSEYVISPSAKNLLSESFKQLYETKTKDFGNGRLVRNIFEKSIENQSNRIALTDQELTKKILTTIEAGDIPNVTIYTT